MKCIVQMYCNGAIHYHEMIRKVFFFWVGGIIYLQLTTAICRAWGPAWQANRENLCRLKMLFTVILALSTGELICQYCALLSINIFVKECHHCQRFWDPLISGLFLIITVEESEKAELEIIRSCQKKRFPEEFSSLLKNQNVKQTSHIYKRNPRIDNGFFRIGGSLNRATMPEELKYTIIMTKDLYITDLLLRQVHKQVADGGRSHMLAKLRHKNSVAI